MSAYVKILPPVGCQFIVRPYMGFEIVYCKRFSIENFLNWQFLGDLRQRFGQEYFLSPGDDDYEGRLPMGIPSDIGNFVALSALL